MPAVKDKESKVERYRVQFYDSGSGWLHSTEEVSDVEPGDVVKTAVANVLERTGEDISQHRAAITNADTGHGIASLDNATTKAQLQAQLDSLRDQLNNLEDDDEEEDSVDPPAVNKGAVTQADLDAQLERNKSDAAKANVKK